MAKTLSVVIPSRNEFQNLIWTLQALQIELNGIDYEVVVVLNKCGPGEAERLRKYWPATTGTLKVIEFNDVASCWQARNTGAQKASGQYLLFLDSHVMPKQGAIRGALNYHQEFRGILHLGVNYWLDHPSRTLYQYKWQPWKFWGSWTRSVPQPPDYRILMAGMNFMLGRDVFEEVGGFHPALGIYGGGEPYIYFKVQVFGYEARCHPDFQVYHLAEKRGYAWTSDDLWRNFMIAAWAVGGEGALGPLYEHYKSRCGSHRPYLDKLDELRNEAVALAENDRKWITARARYTMDEVIKRDNRRVLA